MGGPRGAAGAGGIRREVRCEASGVLAPTAQTYAVGLTDHLYNDGFRAVPSPRNPGPGFGQ